jgi:hypothetical protein
MLPSLLPNIAGALVGAILGFLISKLTQKRKIVEYGQNSISLLRFDPNPEGSIVVSVDKSFLTGDSSDKGQPTPL